MKKIYTLILLILLINLNACKGYKPIFSSSNLKFKIADYSITGNNKFGNQLYAKLYQISKSSENDPEAKEIYVLIDASQNKDATAKDTAGKVLGYKISLLTKVTIKNLRTGNQILNESFSFSSNYKVQDQHSETIKTEERVMESLIDRTFQDLLMKFSENIF